MFAVGDEGKGMGGRGGGGGGVGEVENEGLKVEGTGNRYSSITLPSPGAVA